MRLSLFLAYWRECQAASGPLPEGGGSGPHHLMKPLLLCGLLLACSPALVLLPGCSGGSSTSGVVSNLVLPQSFPVRLSATQTGTLNLETLVGTTLNGTLVIDPAVAVSRTGPGSRVATDIPELPPGTYPVSGAYHPPRGFVLSTALPEPVGAVLVSGTVPLPGNPGEYTINALGQTVSGTIPAPSQG